MDPWHGDHRLPIRAPKMHGSAPPSTALVAPPPPQLRRPTPHRYESESASWSPIYTPSPQMVCIAVVVAAPYAAGGSPYGIRTRDLRLERPASWSTRRTGRSRLQRLLPTRYDRKTWWAARVANPRPPACAAGGLRAELADPSWLGSPPCGADGHLF